MTAKVIKLRPVKEVQGRCGGKKGGCHLTGFYIRAKKAA
jgi:hypothetical protein